MTRKKVTPARRRDAQEEAKLPRQLRYAVQLRNEGKEAKLARQLHYAVQLRNEGKEAELPRQWHYAVQLRNESRWLLLGACLLAGMTAAMAGESVSPALDALQTVHAADAPYRNALYLWLRIAGIAWISVEWVAGIVLWRAYVHLRRAARERGLSP
jgi:hypothetical protein